MNNNPYQSCVLCPRRCGADRTKGLFGFCKSPSSPVVNLVMIHKGEEPVLGGGKGCGAIFFEGCNLKCTFCQNSVITDITGRGTTYDEAGLSDVILKLQDDGAGAIDLVTPMHYAPTVAKALAKAKSSGLVIPVICNCSGYESVSTLRLLDGLVDIYLPDMKFYSSKVSSRYANAPDYFGTACLAIDEMFRQTGSLQYDDDNKTLIRGMIVRHMMLPGNLFDTRHILDYLTSRFGNRIYISLMSQYTPMPQINDDENAPEELKRTISRRSYEQMCDYLAESGQTNAFVQDMTSAGDIMIPDFRHE